MAEKFNENLNQQYLYCINNISSKELNKINLSLGTLGGGNHFIEIDKDEMERRKKIGKCF